jgi:hypothetical protein
MAPFVFLFMHILNPIYICKLILFIVNNVCYFDLDIVWANNVVLKWFGNGARGRGIVRHRGGRGGRGIGRGGLGGRGGVLGPVASTSRIALSLRDYLANGWSETCSYHGNIRIEINLLYIELFSFHMENL